MVLTMKFHFDSVAHPVFNRLDLTNCESIRKQKIYLFFGKTKIKLTQCVCTHYS